MAALSAPATDTTVPDTSATDTSIADDSGGGTPPSAAVDQAYTATQLGPSASTAGASNQKGAQKAQAVDISSYQTNINWQKVKAAGISVAMMKATEGTSFVDSSYAKNRAAANKLGIKVGEYDFARPGTSGGGVDANARAEARHFLQNAHLKSGDLLPELDLEANDNHLSKSQMAEWVKVWSQTVADDPAMKARGDKPFVYTTGSFWDSNVGTSNGPANFHLWVANWGVKSPKLPAGWQAYDGWQYTDHGQVSGISGNVDRDVIVNPQNVSI
jgi:GH25 family lysozyme M1 (1,4-beta-N-acetylmuramidase)